MAKTARERERSAAVGHALRGPLADEKRASIARTVSAGVKDATKKAIKRNKRALV